MKAIGGLFLVGFLMTISISATAAKDARQNPQAVVLFKKGVNAFNKGSFEAALKSFDKAYALRPSWKLLYNIGQCQASLKRYGRALDAFEKYLVSGGDDISLGRQAEVQQEIDRLQRLTGDVTILAPEGSIVFIDKLEVGRCPLPGPIRVSADLHTISISKEGVILLKKQIRVMGRRSITVQADELPPQKIPAHTPAPTATKKEVLEPVVFDKKTKLEWQGCVPLDNGKCSKGLHSTTTWERAKKKCADVSWGGKTDWRLPNEKELRSIVRKRPQGPTIDVERFPNTPKAVFWTSTQASEKEMARFIHFKDGSPGAQKKGRFGAVRCVRGGL